MVICTAKVARMVTCTVEVVRMVDLAPEPQRLPVNDGVALLAHVLPDSVCFHLGVALVAQGSTLTQEGKVMATQPLATEAIKILAT
jgi:hypothetical protein